MKQVSVNGKLFALLLFLGIIGSIAVVPFVLYATGQPAPSFTVNAVFLQLAQVAVVLGIAIFFGLFLARRVGLGMPFLGQWVDGKSPRLPVLKTAGIAIIAGVLVSIVVVALDVLLSGANIDALKGTGAPPLWTRVTAALYGGINEEILLRLFFMSLIVWIVFLISRRGVGKPSVASMWIGVILSAVAFSLGHLPFASQIGSINTLIILQIILLNSVAGIVFGWLFWRKGLEAAMLAHFSADITLLVLIPLAASALLP